MLKQDIHRLPWHSMIEKYNAVRTDFYGKFNLPTPATAFEAGATAIWFETANFGWISVKADDGQRLFKY